MAINPIEAILKDLQKIESFDEVDGSYSTKSIVKRVGRVIVIVSRAIAHLLTILKPCLGTNSEAHTTILEEISKNLGILSQLIVDLTEQDEQRSIRL